MTVTGPAEHPPGQQTWLVHLTPTRPGFPAELTGDERRALAAHAEHLAALTDTGECVIAGPRLDGGLGVGVFDGVSAERVELLLREDPMVVAGYFDAQIWPMRLSFERGAGAAQD